MSIETAATPERTDFIRDIVAADLRDGRVDDRRHALPARAERLPAHRPRQVDLPQFRRRQRVRRPLPPPLRRHQPGQGGAGVHRRDRGRRPLARLRLGRAPLLRVGLLRAALRLGRRPHPGRQGLRRRPLGRRDPRAPRHAHRARPRQPVARPARRREPRPVRADARRRVPGRRAGPARPDRHGLAEHQPARPGPVPDRPRRRIRGPATPGASTRPTTSRTASRTRSRASPTRSARSSSRSHRPLYDWLIEQPAGAVAAAPVRVRAAQPDPHRAVEARPAAARQRGPRARLGRPADADDLRAAPARLPGRGDPRLRDDRSACRRPTASSRSASSSTPSATSSTGRRRAGSPSSTRSRSSSRTTRTGQVEEMEVVNNPEDPSAGTRQGAVRARALDRARRLPWRSRRRSSSASRRAARSACGPPTSSPARDVVKDASGAVVELRCTYDPATRGGDSPDGRRPKATLHWVSAAHAVPGRGPPVRPPLRRPVPGRRRARPVRRPQPGVGDGAREALVEPSLGRRADRRDRPVRAARLLQRRPGLDARTSRSSTGR